MSSSEARGNKAEDGQVTRQQWKLTVLASMADYIDAGSSVAGAAGLALWASYFNMANTTVGVLGAISSGAFSAGLGALIGGRLGDLFGRKRVYTYDLLLYAFGTLWIVFAQSVWMLAIGYFLVGLAVGADIPTSWALIGEAAPRKARGKLMGLTNVFWYIGPIITLLLALALAPLEVLGIRLVFAHLFVVAMVTWYLRRGLVESARWTAAREEATAAASATLARQPQGPDDPLAANRLRGLLTRPIMMALSFTFTINVFWNLAAGTYGFFLPYILSTVGGQSQAASVAIQGLWFGTSIFALLAIFMPFNDRVGRRVMYGVGSALQVIAFLLLVFFPISSTWVAITNVVLFGLGGGIAQFPLYRVWSQELFPTMLRSTAQGFTYGLTRVLLSGWKYVVPILAATGVAGVALVLTIALAISGAVGTVFAPNTAGKSLEEIERERAGGRATN